MDQMMVIDETYADSDLVNIKGQKYPRIIIEEDAILRPMTVPDHLCDYFLDDDKSLIRRMFNRYRSKGFWSMLSFVKGLYEQGLISQDQSPSSTRNQPVETSTNFGLTILYIITIVLLHIQSLCLAIHYYFYPFDKYSDDELLDEFNLNPEWRTSTIRSFAWHSNSLRCALALINDLVYVYSADNRGPMTHVECLKNFQQRRISCMCWHPSRDDLLAVACRHRILIWLLQSDMSKFKSHNADPRHCLQVIDTLLQSPLTSIQFSDDGHCLAACSPRNSTLSVIRFEGNNPSGQINATQVKLIRNGPFLPQFTKLNWSPDSTRLFAHTTSSKKLCVFESKQWSYKLLKLPFQNESICQTSAWSRPSGQFLLFSMKNSSKIYAMIFLDKAEPGDVGGRDAGQPIMVLDVQQQMQQQTVQSKSSQKSHNWSIQQICWNNKSTRLAVSFRGKFPIIFASVLNFVSLDNLDTIALYETELNPALRIHSICLLKSGFNFVEKQPFRSVRCLLMSFHDNYIDPGSLLTVCWSNGFVTHIPFKVDTNQKHKSYHHHSPLNESSTQKSSNQLSTYVQDHTTLSTSIISSPSPCRNVHDYYNHIQIDPMRSLTSLCTSFNESPIDQRNKQHSLRSPLTSNGLRSPKNIVLNNGDNHYLMINNQGLFNNSSTSTATLSSRRPMLYSTRVKLD